MLFSNRQLPESEASYRSAIDLNPEYTDAIYNLARVLDKQEKFSEALSSQKEIKPDIIISDISSTGTEGEELVRQIRNNQPGAHIVLSSGLDDHVYQEKMRNSKVELMIKKPFDIKQLRSVIAQILKKSD
ncbi:MAG: response regulator [Candidatus Marinimicrobia bacterium]|nr:response regulator [Candidatus Neomarinimicrobiota bacterium]